MCRVFSCVVGRGCLLKLEKVSFHSNPKERQCQRMLKLHSIALIWHNSKTRLKILQARLQQYKRRLYTSTSPDGQHRYQIDYILSSQRWRISIQSAKTRQGAVCGSDHEFFISKFRLKLKKVGKITRPFRYDLNQ